MRLGGAALFLMVLAALLLPGRGDRLLTFFDPSADAGLAGFQEAQAQAAIDSGGFFGRGIGSALQASQHLPGAESDFILAVVAELLGVVGVWFVLICLVCIAYGGLRTAKQARTAYERLLALGLTTVVIGQAVLNAFATGGLAPASGTLLPFVSYGGSALVANLGAAGLLLNLSRRARTDAASPADSTRPPRRNPPAVAAAWRRGGARINVLFATCLMLFAMVALRALFLGTVQSPEPRRAGLPQEPPAYVFRVAPR